MTDWFQDRRQSWMVESFVIFGSLNRSHVAKKFGVSLQTAAADFALLKANFPEAITYDRSNKRYVLRTCRKCNCNFFQGCEGLMGEGCHWVEPDLCSSCGP